MAGSARVAQPGDQRQEGPGAEDDRRHAGSYVDNHPKHRRQRRRRVLGEQDGYGYGDRHGDQQGQPRRDQRSDDERQRAIGAGRGVPDLADQEAGPEARDCRPGRTGQFGDHGGQHHHHAQSGDQRCPSIDNICWHTASTAARRAPWACHSRYELAAYRRLHHFHSRGFHSLLYTSHSRRTGFRAALPKPS